MKPSIKREDFSVSSGVHLRSLGLQPFELYVLFKKLILTYLLENYALSVTIILNIQEEVV